MNLFAEQIPFFLCFLSIGLLISLKETFLLLLYFGGFLANGLLNQYLKPIIQDPRPIPLSPTDKYGMPSGHSQLAAYSLVFITLTVREKYYGIIFLFLFLTITTMTQRIVEKAHTLEQVIIGSLLGGFLGYITYGLSKKRLFNSL